MKKLVMIPTLAVLGLMAASVTLADSLPGFKVKNSNEIVLSFVVSNDSYKSATPINSIIAMNALTNGVKNGGWHGIVKGIEVAYGESQTGTLTLSAKRASQSMLAFSTPGGHYCQINIKSSRNHASVSVTQPSDKNHHRGPHQCELFSRPNDLGFSTYHLSIR